MTPTRRLPVTTSELDALAFLVRLGVAVNVAIPPIHALLTDAYSPWRVSFDVKRAWNDISVYTG